MSIYERPYIGGPSFFRKASILPRYRTYAIQVKQAAARKAVGDPPDLVGLPARPQRPNDSLRLPAEVLNSNLSCQSGLDSLPATAAIPALQSVLRQMDNPSKPTLGR